MLLELMFLCYCASVVIGIINALIVIRSNKIIGWNIIFGILGIVGTVFAMFMILIMELGNRLFLNKTIIKW